MRTCSFWVQGCGTWFCHDSNATNLKKQLELEVADLNYCVAGGHKLVPVCSWQLSRPSEAARRV